MTDVYLVDDHVMLRDGLRAVLQVAGYHVVGESADPTQALADLQRLAPAVLLLDLQLGQRSGFELLTQIQRRRLPVRTIVLTMSAQPRHVAEALRLGALGYVLKGASAAELMGAIDSVLQGRRYLGGDVADLAVQGLTARDGETALNALSARERQIVVLVVRGQSSAEIASLLHLSPKTVDSYRSRLMAKIGVADVPALVRFAIRAGLIDAEERRAGPLNLHERPAWRVENSPQTGTLPLPKVQFTGSAFRRPQGAAPGRSIACRPLCKSHPAPSIRPAPSRRRCPP